MKRWWLLLAACLLFHGWKLWPFPQLDAGDLYIVETLLVEIGEDEVRLWAEGVEGQGRTMAEALENLEHNTPGELFLRQTERVIFCRGAETRLDGVDLPDQLPLGAVVYSWTEPGRALKPERANRLLAARERRQEQLPNLAQLENCRLAGRAPLVKKLEWEGADE